MQKVMERYFPNTKTFSTLTLQIWRYAVLDGSRLNAGTIYQCSSLLDL